MPKVRKRPDSTVLFWRMQWEVGRDPGIGMTIREYNKADCKALMLLTNFIANPTPTGLAKGKGDIRVGYTDDLKLIRPHWQLFQPKPFALEDLEHVNKSAYFDYQREKVFVRTHPQFKVINNRNITRRTIAPKPNKIILLESERCPDCLNRNLERYNMSSHDVVDLVFSRRGVRSSVTRYVSWRYRCRRCLKTFRSEDRLPHPQKYGLGLAGWCVYSGNSVLGVNLSKVSKRPRGDLSPSFTIGRRGAI